MENYLYTGFITLISGFISSYITIRFGLHKDLVVTRRERIEKYAMSLISIDLMLEQYRQRYLFSDDDTKIDEMGLGTVEMLTKLYFSRVASNFHAFNKAVGLYKQSLFVIRSQLLVAQQVSENPAIKPIPTKHMIDECTSLTRKVFEERNELLNALIEAYPLLDDKGITERILIKVRSLCD